MTSFQIPGAHCAIFRAGVVSRIMDRAGAGSKANRTPQLAARNPCRPVQPFQSVARALTRPRRVMRTAIDSPILPRHLAVRLLVVVQGDADDNRSVNSFGPFKAARRFIPSLHQLRQKSRSGFTQAFDVLLWLFARHGPNHGASNVGKIRNPFGAENEFR